MSEKYKCLKCGCIGGFIIGGIYCSKCKIITINNTENLFKYYPNLKNKLKIIQDVSVDDILINYQSNEKESGK